MADLVVALADEGQVGVDVPVAGDLAVLEVDGEADLGESLQELVVVALQLGLVGLLLVVPAGGMLKK